MATHGNRRSSRKVTPEDVGEVFSFLFTEIVRLQRLGLGVRDELQGLDFLCSIYDSDRRMRLVGRPAYERLRDLTNRIVDQTDYRGRLDLDRTFTCVRTGFGRDYIRPDFEATTDEEDFENLLRWIEEAAQGCRTLTHYVPMQMGLPEGETFTVGPVTVEPSLAVLERLRRELSAEEPVVGDDARWRAKENRRALTYLASFSDIATVRIVGCDPETSRRVADEVVQAALAFIHVMAGAESTSKVRVGGPAVRNAQRSTLAVDEDGTPFMTWTGDWEGARLDVKFWSWLRSDHQKRLSDTAGTAIQFIADRIDPTMMAARYLDGAAWYADAVTDRRRPAAVVKYLTSMERLLFTGESKITDLLATRAAALCFEVEPWNFEALKKDIKRAYNLRSEIVHGRVRNDDPKVTKNFWLCERVARDLLSTWLFRYGADFQKHTTVAKLQGHLNGFVAEVKEETAKRRQTSELGSGSLNLPSQRPE